MDVTTRNPMILDSARRAWCLRVALLVAVICGFSLAASGTARAAECPDTESCINDATWQKAVSDEYYRQAFFAGADAQNNFKAAADWHNKSIAAFLSGNGSAAQLYQAVANDYARKAAASATAADNYLAAAKSTAAAADHNFRRYVSMANDSEGVEPGEPITAVASATAKGIGVKSLKKAKVICKRHWAASLVCDYVISKTIDGGLRYVWKMVSGRTCLRQVARYNVNPSTGYVEKVYHDCVKWA